MSAVLALTDEAKPLDQEAIQLSPLAELQVTDDASLAVAVTALKTIKLFLKRVADLFDPIDRAQIDARNVTIAKRKELEGPALSAERTLKQRVAAHEQRLEDERRAAEEAARVERERRERLAEEAAKAATAALTKVADDEALQAALEAEAAGDVQAADRILAAPRPVPVVLPPPQFTPPVAIARPTPVGLTFSTTWKAQITNPLALVQAIAAGRAPLSLIKAFDQSALDTMARTQKKTLRLPGVVAVETKTPSVSLKK